MTIHVCDQYYGSYQPTMAEIDDPETHLRDVLRYYRTHAETNHVIDYWQHRYQAVLAYCRQHYPVLAMEEVL